ncbi:MAG: NUDIX hydrolase [Burkholderiaceae bacterium]
MPRATLPRPASTTLLLRDAADGLRVLMLRRSASARFMPGALVFPGGAVDAADHSAAIEACCAESRADAFSRLRLGDATDGLALAHAVAALRECFEECGLWLGADMLVEARALADARRRLLAGSARIDALSAELSVPLATRALAPWSHWVTPIDAERRFDTVFFVAMAPLDQAASAEGGEATGVAWTRPVDALATSAGDALPFATRRTLESLLPFRDSVSVMRAARRPRRMPTLHPRVARTRAGDRCVLLPRDAGYRDVMRLDPEGTGAAVVPEAPCPPRPPPADRRLAFCNHKTDQETS